MPGRFCQNQEKVVVLSVSVWKSDLCPHDGGETDVLQHKGLSEVIIHLDQREANMHTLTYFCTHIEKTCEALYLAVLVVIFPNDCLLSLFTSISLIPSLLILSSCCTYDSVLYSCFLFIPMYYWGPESLLRFLFLAQEMNAEHNSVPSHFYYNTSMHVCCFEGEK